MSDLIERVRDVLVKNESETFKDQARAAIAAVAEWIAEHRQIDKDGAVHCALTWQYTSSALEAKP